MTEPENPSRQERTTDRYRAYEAEDGSTVIYDVENDAAWVRTDATVEIER